MSSFRLVAAAAALALGVSAGVSAQTTAQATAQRQSTPAVFSVIGCVERIAPTPPPARTEQTPTYKLTDVQPGVVGQKPVTVGSEYQLAGSAEIDFTKHQNQWVEVTGTLAAPAPPVVASSGRGGGSAQKPASVLPIFTVTAVKVVNTECKG
jgi:hypothetical protein